MMTSLAICILMSLLAGGVCLECEVCEGPGNSCNGPLDTCNTGEDMCGIVLTVSTLEEVKAQRVFKGCATSSICKTGPLSVTFGRGMTIRTIIACCVGEACQTLNVTVPPADTKPNGQHCPGCYALFTDQCSAETVACTGFQTQCIHIEERITSGGNPIQLVKMGCASESFCAQTKVGPGTFAGISSNITMAKCTTSSITSGVAPGAAGHLLPAFAGLLLLKILS